MSAPPLDPSPSRDRHDQGPALAATMTAIVQDRWGDDARTVLRVDEVNRPDAGDKEVLLRVGAASVGMETWHLMTGVPYPMRAVFGVRRPKLLNPGRSLAGVVVAVGRKVTTLEPGDEVYGVGAGAFAEYAVAREDRLTRKPANLTMEEAAAAPVSGLAALDAVRDHGHVHAGQHVLVIGAAGGVGSFAVQIAKAEGAEVTAVVSTGKIDLARSIGADHVIDYTVGDFADAGVRYDVILDIAGNRTLRHLRHALAPDGRLVIVGGETDGKWLGGLDRQLRARLLSPFTRQWLGSFVSTEDVPHLDALRELVEAGVVTPAVGHIYALEDVPTAIHRVREGRTRGKVAVTI